MGLLIRYSFLIWVTCVVAACGSKFDDEPDPSQSGTGSRYELAQKMLGAVFLDYPDGEFAMEYDYAQKHSRWVAWQLLKRHMGAVKRTDAWQGDARIPVDYRSDNDFYRSGYDRGHLCPSADRTYSADLNEITFMYSNMSPQRNAFNAGIWADLESRARVWAKTFDCDTLFICAGGSITSPELIERYIGSRTDVGKGLAVPKYYFKVFLRKNKSTKDYDAIGFWFEHRDYGTTPLSSAIKSVREIEQLAGINFFYALPAVTQDIVETRVTPSKWGFQ